MKSSVLVVVAVWISLVAGRRLSTRSVLDNEIDLADSGELDRNRNWITITPPKGEIKVLYGETVELECEASGSPPPTIQFYRDANDLTKNEIFSNEIVKPASTGLAKAKARFRFVAKKTEVIFCKATSGSKSSHVAFRVFVSGSKLGLIGNDIWGYKVKEESKHKAPRINYFDTTYLDVIGTTVVLPCTASGAGEVDTIWLNATEFVVADGSDKRITTTPFGDLKIKNIRWSDMGPYTCVARNSYGQDSITTFLYPLLAEK